MSTQHTPGPWEIDDEYVKQSGNPDVGICRVLNMDKGGDKQWFRGPITEANAHLIAAAPDMYEALKELYAVVKGECPSLLDEDSGGDSRLALEIESALAKAEGKS